jgi:hypothetical protein
MEKITDYEKNYYNQLDERQRRLFAGLLAKKLGHGGIKKVSECFGLHVNTVSKGKVEVLNPNPDLVQGIRRKGGGAKKK